MTIGNRPKRTIFASGGLGLLQMGSEPNTVGVLARMLAPKEVDCEIPHRLERGTKHFLLGCGSLSLPNIF